MPTHIEITSVTWGVDTKVLLLRNGITNVTGIPDGTVIETISDSFEAKEPYSYFKDILTRPQGIQL